ncbi:F-box domain-containing protein [Mycena sanguinolenta]|uniref:F-box domain-containing protein n=1 Tax=Mycena sanguinolenta TaxID=230812 RepID=A0A8H6XT85_9AGAR|nr:F-box domain-containing protein [Mycena sanguinolenta]
MTTTSSFSVRAILQKAREYSKVELERRVEESEMKIKSLEKQLAALMELRDRERALVATLKSLLSPIRTMPPELLAEIFEHAIGDDTHIKDVFRMSQVCSEWRQVAQRTPRLWTGRISVTLDNKGDQWEQAYIDGWKTWLSRSAALPIPITLTLESADIHHDLLEEVLKTASRWRSLRLDFPDHGLTLVRQLAQSGLDSLEEIDLGRTSFIEPLDGVIPSCTTAPRLRKLGMSISSSLPILVPWANLTDLTLHDLLKVSVRTVGWPVLPQARQHNLALNYLRTLSFALCEDAEHFAPFFSNLSAPALQELCLNFGGMCTLERWVEAHFTVFQLQAPNITSLDFQYAELVSDELIAAIRHAPALTHLKLFRCPGFDEGVIDALRYEDGVTPLVPHLHYLVLESMEHYLLDNILASMIATRWWTDATLASRSVPPAVARWTHVELWYDLSGHFLLDEMPSDILKTSTREYVDGDRLS